MGAKYSSTTVSSYNASPPSDDGSTAASNQVLWATIKTKLGDPLNSFASAVNSALVSAFDYSMRSVTSADSTVLGDHMRTLQVPSSVTVTFTISLGDASTMTNGYIVRIRNSSNVGITIGRATAGDTLDGTAANKLLPPGASAWYAVNQAANGYVTMGYSGPVQDSDAIVAGSSDGTKKMRFEVDGLTTGNTRIMTVPDYDGTIATLAGTETLTNKTLTDPKIVGTATNDNAAAGDVGEYVESIVSSNSNFGSTGVWQDATNISLTAGDWDVTLIASIAGAGSTQANCTVFQAGISTTSGNSATGLTEGENMLYGWRPDTSASDGGCVISSYRMSLGSTTTVYAKRLASYTGTTPVGNCRLSARRRR